VPAGPVVPAPSGELAAPGVPAGQVGSVRLEVVYSLAGRVRAPALPVTRDGAGVRVRIRVGGFGGPAGLAGYLRRERIDLIVDATHPFAATMTASAVWAAAEVGIDLLVLRRPGWREVAGDDWRRVPSIAAAATAVDLLGGRAERVFLTTGRKEIAAFAHLDRHSFLFRSVDPPEPPMPRRMEVVLDRGPFTVDGEVALMLSNRIQVLVTKDSGGGMTVAKLTAARSLGLPVVMIERPAFPVGVAAIATVATVDAARAFLVRWIGA
jgi:precorrin-6A/cobalt-precorrin-6A reductase